MSPRAILLLLVLECALAVAILHAGLALDPIDGPAVTIGEGDR